MSPIITTITSTETVPRHARVVVGEGWSELRRGERIAPRVLGPGRLTLLRSQAGPLAGDHDRVEIVVESGALRIEPIAATVALPGPERTRLELDIAVAEGATLYLQDAPLVVAAGADVVRMTTIRLGERATAIVHDLVVLGRAGEAPGRLDSLLRIEGPDGVILHDALRIEPGEDGAYVALAPGHRAVGMVAHVGALAEPPVTMGDAPHAHVRAAHASAARGALDAGGTLWRASGASAADVVALLGASHGPAA